MENDYSEQRFALIRVCLAEIALAKELLNQEKVILEYHNIVSYYEELLLIAVVEKDERRFQIEIDLLKAEIKRELAILKLSS